MEKEFCPSCGEELIEYNGNVGGAGVIVLKCDKCGYVCQDNSKIF